MAIAVFNFEGKIKNDSKVIAFTKNHTDNNTDNYDNGTKNHMSPPDGRGGGTTCTCNRMTSNVHMKHNYVQN